ncbi:MAG: universal stress protein [Gammaproteobacteria bacterium]|nr:universal stress protein [Gammaproteobacteria bacterium]
MGTTARRGVKGLVIGNSAERVLAKAPCDVLALKP